jgi:protocatechuate 3,4-dioxygenase beta subunit
LKVLYAAFAIALLGAAASTTLLVASGPETPPSRAGAPSPRAERIGWSQVAAGTTAATASTVAAPVPGRNARAEETRPGETVSIRGFVRDRSGQPIRGAHVELDSFFRSLIARVETDAAGAFRFEGSLTSQGGFVRAAHSGFAEAGLALVGPGERPNELVLEPLILGPGGVIRGTTRIQGMPLPTTVTLMTVKRGHRSNPRLTESGVDGSFAFRDLPEGVYEVSASASDLVCSEGAFVAAAPEKTTDVEIALSSLARVRGSVHRVSGEGGFGIHISAYQAGHKVGHALCADWWCGDGTFEVRSNVRPGRTVVVAESPSLGECAMVIMEASPGENDVELTLVPDTSIAGRLTDARGEPRSWRTVVFRHVETGWSRHGRTDEEGRYCLDHLIPGDYSVECEVERGYHGEPGLQARVAAGVQLVPGAQTLDLVTPAEAELEGWVVGPDGGPPPFCEVRLEDADGGSFRVFPGKDGSFRLGGLPAGTFWLRVSDGDNLAMGRALTLREGERLDVGVLGLAPSAYLRVRVVDPKGDRIAGLEVSIRPAGTRGYLGYNYNEGPADSRVFGPLCAGRRYTIELDGPSRALAVLRTGLETVRTSQEVLVGESGEHEAVLTLSPDR